MPNPTQLELIGNKERDVLLGRNEYNYNDLYNSGNPNAISDGDEKGRGEGTNGEIGTKTDIYGSGADPGRIALQAKNVYTPNNGYGLTNPNAVSDGDEKGRGEGPNGEVGTLTDINERTKLQVKNIYNDNNGYGLTNPNAISDGDEKGRGESSNGTVGTLTDINERTKEQAINRFGPNYKYPDF